MQNANALSEAGERLPKRSRRWMLGLGVLAALLWLWARQGTCDPRLIGTWISVNPPDVIGNAYQWRFHDHGLMEMSFFVGPMPTTSLPHRWRVEGNELVVLPERKVLGNLFADVERVWLNMRGQPTSSRYLIERIGDKEFVLTPVPADWPTGVETISFRRE